MRGHTFTAGEDMAREERSERITGVWIRSIDGRSTTATSIEGAATGLRRAWKLFVGESLSARKLLELPRLGPTKSAT